MADFGRHFQDPRYIRVQGRPLLMIYRPRLIPDTAETVARWRAMFQEQFDEDPIIIMAQSFDDSDPRVFGLDGAIEFPPHKLTAELPPINNRPPDPGRRVRRARSITMMTLFAVSLEEPPRRPSRSSRPPCRAGTTTRAGRASGLTLTGSTPAKYEDWLTAARSTTPTRTPFFGEAFVCVNAWNEWCEGAYLEPDLHYRRGLSERHQPRRHGRVRSGPTRRACPDRP